MEMTRLRFQDLLGEGGCIEEEVRLTQGQMLLLCLNGLFEKVENGLIKLANHLQNMPPAKNHVELLEDAQHRMVKSVKRDTISVLLTDFFLSLRSPSYSIIWKTLLWASVLC